MRKFRCFQFQSMAIVSLAFAAIAASGCADSRGGSIPYNVSDFGRPDLPSVVPVEEDYKVAPMDTLSVRVFGDPDLTGDYQVDLRGMISMPLIGDVVAINLRPTELDELLTNKYSERYFENPDVSVAIKSSAGRNVTVDGAVNKGGLFPISGSTTLLQAVALAGGINEETANAHRVAVFRTLKGQRQAAAFDLVSIRRGGLADPPIFAGDIIIVDGSRIKEAQKRILLFLPLVSRFTPVLL